ncbi:hydroxymyristoyl-ACP dehydratase [Geomonas sp. Red276]
MVTALSPGLGATGEYQLAADGIFPPILLVEAMAQVGGIASGRRDGKLGVLAALRQVRLPAELPPGGRVTVTSTIVRSYGSMLLVAGEASLDGEPVASATLTLALEQ